MMMPFCCIVLFITCLFITTTNTKQFEIDEYMQMIYQNPEVAAYQQLLASSTAAAAAAAAAASSSSSSLDPYQPTSSAAVLPASLASSQEVHSNQGASVSPYLVQPTYHYSPIQLKPTTLQSNQEHQAHAQPHSHANQNQHPHHHHHHHNNRQQLAQTRQNRNVHNNNNHNTNNNHHHQQQLSSQAATQNHQHHHNSEPQVEQQNLNRDLDSSKLQLQVKLEGAESSTALLSLMRNIKNQLLLNENDFNSQQHQQQPPVAASAPVQVHHQQRLASQSMADLAANSNEGPLAALVVANLIDSLDMDQGGADPGGVNTLGSSGGGHFAPSSYHQSSQPQQSDRPQLTASAINNNSLALYRLLNLINQSVQPASSLSPISPLSKTSSSSSSPLQPPNSAMMANFASDTQQHQHQQHRGQYQADPYRVANEISRQQPLGGQTGSSSSNANGWPSSSSASARKRNHSNSLREITNPDNLNAIELQPPSSTMKFMKNPSYSNNQNQLAPSSLTASSPFVSRQRGSSNNSLSQQQQQQQPHHNQQQTSNGNLLEDDIVGFKSAKQQHYQTQSSSNNNNNNNNNNSERLNGIITPSTMSESSKVPHDADSEIIAANNGPRCDKFTPDICVDDFEYPEQAIIDEIQKKRDVFELMYSEVKDNEPLVDGIPRDVEESYNYDYYYLGGKSNMSQAGSQLAPTRLAKQQQVVAGGRKSSLGPLGPDSTDVRSLWQFDSAMANIDGMDALIGAITPQSAPSSSHPQQVQSPPQTGFICPSEVMYGKPKLAKNKKGFWKVIVNAGEFTQTVRLEKCLLPNKKCNYVSAISFESRCAQVHSYHRLLVFEKGRGFYIDTFRLPTGCNCHVTRRQQTSASRAHSASRE